MYQLLNYKRGIVSLIVLFIIAIVLLSAFKVNLRGYLESTPEQALDDNFVLVLQTGKVIWKDYIRYPIKTIWEEYIVSFLKGKWLAGLEAKLKADSTLAPE
jgi:hypothetical protein